MAPAAAIRGPAAGALLISGQHERERSGVEPSTTNNRMELQAVIEALRALKRRVRARAFTDRNTLGIAPAAGLEGARAGATPRATGEEPVTREQLTRLPPGTRLNGTGEGAFGNPGNERCDQLANAAIDAPFGAISR
jgi:ribonuclease HI